MAQASQVGKCRKCLHRFIGFLRNFIGPAIVSAITVAVFLRSYYKYRYCPQYCYLYGMLGDSLCWSRGSASVLCVSCCLVLLPMCRNVLAQIRNSNKVIGRIFRRLLDKNIWFHKACAIVIIISTGIHIGAHFVNARRFSVNYSFNFTDLNFASYHNQCRSPTDQYKYLPVAPWIFYHDLGPRRAVVKLLRSYLSNSSQRQGNGKEMYQNVKRTCRVAGLTGILMALLLLAMIVTSTTAVRRASYETFWYTHHLFIVFFLLLFVHGFGGIIKHQINLDTHSPGCEMAKNKTTSANTSQVTWCSEDPVFQADEPEAWKWCIGPLFIYIMERLIRVFRSFQKVELIQVVQHGDRVVEVKMRKLNFTAAPGQYVFVKCADVSRFEWHPFTLTQCPSSEDPTFSIHCKILGDWTERFTDRLFQTSSKEEKKTLACRIQNGKYSSYVKSNIKIAVDGPYGSPCMDIWSYDVSVCIATGIGVTPFAAIINELRQKVKFGRQMKLKRLYFVWVCKHVESFQWFVDLLHSTHTELWENNRPDFLICNFYVTCTGSQFEEQVNAKTSIDWLTSRMHKNKPVWKEVFDRVSCENPRTKVGVFYCGSRKVTSVLKKICQRFYPTRTRFIFSKEVLT